MIDVASALTSGNQGVGLVGRARRSRPRRSQAPTPHLHSDHVGTPTADVVTELVNELCARQGLDPATLPVCIGLRA